jgi:predicted nucleic-acid-binding Zn-ribbon protein
MKNCPKCNSDKIIPNAMVLDTGEYASGYLQIAIDEHPEAFVFKQRIKSGVKVSVCGNCGYLEFYAGEPGLMYQAYQNMLNNK